MVDSVERLYDAVIATREGAGFSPRTRRLFDKGRPFIAKKLAEEAVEVALDATVGNRAAVICESADLIYNLVVLWADAGVSPDDVWAEMRRREELLGMAEKLPKAVRDPAGAAVPSADEPAVARAFAGGLAEVEPPELHRAPDHPLPPLRPRRG
ncbi:phosphoribosyl-ATP diphosphatase [Ancylobacter lacus]|uniref:phosphoribosyl-ATP diphosphatase n=1 Tax=Ancylobacter lacus TaxID=2579970 RepID=UPI001BCBAC02|nr:phosphoribosyl-ATP diphosphatase [Ancylobacter lacus]MBS7537875.1 phosphoribosyl-ATP diphosphatase [Ancylobacter lacus]